MRGICLWLFGIYNYNTTSLLCVRDSLQAGEAKAVFISSRVLCEYFFLSSHAVLEGEWITVAVQQFSTHKLSSHM